jgi:putative FmdB family regulatory protein
MPAYDYACRDCGHRFELRQKMSDAPAESCPQCGGNVKRLLSAGAGAIVKDSSAAPAPCGAGACCAPKMRDACCRVN